MKLLQVQNKWWESKKEKLKLYPGQRQSKNSCRFLGGYLTFLVEPYRVQPKKAGKSIVLTKPEGRG